MLGTVAGAGLGLELAVLPPAPDRELDPVVERPTSRAVPMGPEDREAVRALSRYSAGATPAWTQLGLALTAAGARELASETETVQAFRRDARSARVLDVEGLRAHHRRVVSQVHERTSGGVNAPLLARLDRALPELRPGATRAVPPRSLGENPAAELQVQLEDPGCPGSMRREAERDWKT
jgi:hypothetical protein